MTLAHAEIAPIDALRSGLGAIQLRLVGALEHGISPGGREVYFRNNHRPNISVYMVNALVPEDRDVSVTRQSRNVTQQEVQIGYHVGLRWPVPILWLVFGSSALLTLMIIRSRSQQTT